MYQKKNETQEPDAKVFDVTVKRPKVLLLGNGITRISSNNGKYSLRKVVNKWCNIKSANFEDVPFPILTMVFGGKKRDLVTLFEGKNYSTNKCLKQLLSLGFDEILTANYTYEIENEIDKEYVNYNSKKQLKMAASYFKDKSGNRRKENNIMIQTFNRLSNSQSNKEYHIWHIHGELRNSQSLVLSHEDYEKLTAKIGNYLDRKYNEFTNSTNSYSFESWIDYLLFGDVYIMGLGLYFSEYDLWWLLNERKKRNIKNTIVYYEPYSDEEYDKQEMLKKIGVKVKDLGSVKTIKKPFDFKEFYEKAYCDLQTYL